jgi:hypothetical protein
MDKGKREITRKKRERELERERKRERARVRERKREKKRSNREQVTAIRQGAEKTTLSMSVVGI